MIVIKMILILIMNTKMEEMELELDQIVFEVHPTSEIFTLKNQKTASVFKAFLSLSFLLFATDMQPMICSFLD